ncbi:alkaline phosphatase D family protein [Pseudoalteromonas ruthenica]|uniref:alkaline phosphatase D family protein n=1 Tax=Pseudoalteromonas ruthenica TaxID=151081 RepID=UPI001247ABD2|nr:alkaline phosphatase D family protein [Pseudoalteromonas ruthenica]
MSAKLLLGPILGLESDTLYTFVFVTDNNVQQCHVAVEGQNLEAVEIGSLSAGKVWKARIELETTGYLDYRITINGEDAADQQGQQLWTFYVPEQGEKPRLAYASCNGFSDYKMMNATEKPYYLWREMHAQHQQAPFSLLLMGGDQVYADSIWSQVPTLQRWNELDKEQKITRQVSKEMRNQVTRFYSQLYLARWNKAPMAAMLASVPSLMMWDDHDIFDGWGSYPDDLQSCPVYQCIYEAAREVFTLLQLRGSDNHGLLAGEQGCDFSFALRFRDYHILALDNRSERSLSQVMSDNCWAHVTDYLDSQCQQGDLLVMTAVPVVYRDFSFAERAVDATPWQEELTDDLKDHWRAKEHEGERARLIMRLIDNAKQRQGKTVLLSGDVHVGALGVIRAPQSQGVVKIHQVVSSGIMHPAPTFMQWLGICAITNDDLEYIDEGEQITASMLRPFGSAKYIRARNFVSMCQGDDGKLWVNWLIEGKDKPSYPIN